MQVADENRAAELMLQIGGSFAQHLARAFRVADSDNRARILAAWPDLFERYARMAADPEVVAKAAAKARALSMLESLGS